MNKKYKLVSNNCVNSNWKARFLAEENEEYCQCSFGECKVKVAIEHNGHLSHVYVLTEKELSSLDKPDKNKCPKCDGWLKKWFDRQIFTGMHCGNCGYFSSLDKPLPDKNI